MRASLIAVICSTLLLLAAAVSVPPNAFATASAAKCSAAGYSKSLVKCQIVPSHGSYSIPISHSKDALIGTGSKSTSGTQITVIRVPAPDFYQRRLRHSGACHGEFQGAASLEGQVIPIRPGQ